MAGLLALHRSPERDPDGSRLAATLNAHLTLEYWAAGRALLVHLIAALSGPVWLAAAWPGLAAPLRRLALSSWAVAVIGAALVFAAELRWRRKRDRLVHELTPDAEEATRSHGETPARPGRG